MTKKKPEPLHPHNPPGPPIRPPSGGPPPNPPGGGPPDRPDPTNVLLLKIIAQQQEDHALLLEMQKEMRHNHEESKKCCKELKEDIEEIDENVEEILGIVKEILVLVTPPAATDFRLVQLKGDSPMPINGVQAGQSADFLASLVPSNAAALQSGPTFSTDDTLVTLTPAPNGDPFGIVATVDATDANASFNLKVDGTTTNGAITHTFVIPILQAPPPQAVDFDLTQLTGTQINPLKK